MRRILLATITALALAGCTSSFDAGPATGDAVPPTADAPAPVATTAAPTPAVAGILNWWKNGGEDATSMLQADLKQIEQDSQGGTIDTMSTDCIQLTADVTVAQKLPAMPDSIAQKHWAAAIKALHKGALDCNAGASAGSVSKVERAGREMDAAGPEFEAFAQRVAQLTP